MFTGVALAVSELPVGLIERHGQTDVAVEVGSLGHGNFRIAEGRRTQAGVG